MTAKKLKTLLTLAMLAILSLAQLQPAHALTNDYPWYNYYLSGFVLPGQPTGAVGLGGYCSNGTFCGVSVQITNVCYYQVNQSGYSQDNGTQAYANAEIYTSQTQSWVVATEDCISGGPWYNSGGFGC